MEERRRGEGRERERKKMGGLKKGVVCKISRKRRMKGKECI